MTQYATYSGIPDDSILGATMTLHRGATPSVCTLRMTPEAPTPDDGGTLELSDGQTSVRLTNCAVTSGSRRMEKDRHGAWFREIQISDRRHFWNSARITWRGNERLPDGSLSRESTYTGNVRSARQLAETMLTKLGVQTFDVTDLPATSFPTMNWNGASCGTALAELAEAYGCVICLRSGDSVAVRRLGLGDELPTTDAMLPTQPYRRHAPAVVRAMLGPTMVQASLELEAVGLDTDGSIIPKDDLSYVPDHGWEEEPAEWFPGVAAGDRPLALTSVWRWYRVVAEGARLTGVPFPIRSTTQILPLHPWHVDTGGWRDGGRTRRDAYVTGEFWQQGDLPGTTDEDRRVNADFKLDLERGIVMFDYPVHDIGTNGYPKAPVLKLHCVVNVRDADGETLRHVIDRGVPGGDRGVETVSVPWLWKAEGASSSGPAEMLAEAGALAGMLAEARSPQTCEDMAYAGIQPIWPDGRIAQVMWQVGYGRAPMTRASTGVEFDWYSRSYSERRDRERVRDLWERRR